MGCRGRERANHRSDHSNPLNLHPGNHLSTIQAVRTPQCPRRGDRSLHSLVRLDLAGRERPSQQEDEIKGNSVSFDKGRYTSSNPAFVATGTAFPSTPNPGHPTRSCPACSICTRGCRPPHRHTRSRPQRPDADDLSMPQLHHAWPLLLPLAAMLATCVLGTLTHYQRHERTTHDLIRKTKQRRQDRATSLNARTNGGEVQNARAA